MGIAASVHNRETVDSSQLCTACDREAVYVFKCEKCDTVACSGCCTHRPKESNPLYRKQLYTVRVDELSDEPKQEFKRVRCGCFTFRGKLALLCCYYHKDNKCKCCDITSHWKLCFIDGGGKIISDRLHDTETGRYPGQMTFSREKNKTYMTAPLRKTVYMLSSSNNANIAFLTLGKCYGIACFDAGLAVSVLIESDFHLPEWQVQFLDFDGNLKQRVAHNRETSKPLFSSPRYLASNILEKTLFVSDSDTHAITALDNKGDVLFQYTHSNIKTPRGITVDSENNIYVADGHAVIQIEAGGNDSHVLLNKSNQRDDVVDVLFKPENESLVVIQSNGTVTTFTYQA